MHCVVISCFITGFFRSNKKQGKSEPSMERVQLFASHVTYSAQQVHQFGDGVAGIEALNDGNISVFK